MEVLTPHTLDDALALKTRSQELPLTAAPAALAAYVGHDVAVGVRPESLFDASVYYRGALTLHALRRTVGDEAFFTILRTWVARHSGGSVTTADFEALAAEVCGRDLTALFDAWLRRSALPDLPA